MVVKHGYVATAKVVLDSVASSVTRALTEAKGAAAATRAAEKNRREATPLIELVNVYCPKCGNKFTHARRVGGKTAGGISGAAAGAALGAKIGIAAGPLGAFARTVPGAIAGAFFGSSKGGKLDRPKCDKCGTAFDMP